LVGVVNGNSNNYVQLGLDAHRLEVDPNNITEVKEILQKVDSHNFVVISSQEGPSRTIQDL
jgi:hypothetical protein